MSEFEKADPDHNLIFNSKIYYTVIHTIHYPFEVLTVEDDFLYVPVRGEDLIMKLKIHEYSSEFDYYWAKYDY